MPTPEQKPEHIITPDPQPSNKSDWYESWQVEYVGMEESPVYTPVAEGELYLASVMIMK